MRLKSIGLLSAAIACVTALSISISSCDSNKGPVTPGSHGGVDQGKNPRVLSDLCKNSIGVTDCANGGATLSYNGDGDLVASNLSTTQNTVTCTFDQPANVWHGFVDVDFPATGGALAYEAQDDAGNTEARIDLKQSANGWDCYPTFTSTPAGGDALYDAYILDNGTVVGQQLSISATDVIRLNPDASLCTLKVHYISWDVFQVNSQCEWKFGFNPCCTIQFQLPDGSLINGNQIKFVERNARGVYVYLQTKRITTSGNVSSYAIKTASAVKTE